MSKNRIWHFYVDMVIRDAKPEGKYLVGVLNPVSLWDRIVTRIIGGSFVSTDRIRCNDDATMTRILRYYNYRVNTIKVYTDHWSHQRVMGIPSSSEFVATIATCPATVDVENDFKLMHAKMISKTYGSGVTFSLVSTAERLTHLMLANEVSMTTFIPVVVLDIREIKKNIRRALDSGGLAKSVFTVSGTKVYYV